MAIDTTPEHGAALEDEWLAVNSSAQVLISTTSSVAVEAIAYRIHRSSSRAESPFIAIQAEDLPADKRGLHHECARVFKAAGAGSVLVNNVERMSACAQGEFLAWVDSQRDGRPDEHLQLFAGTTVSLFDHVTAGTFSERLFYRLNVLHLVSRVMPSDPAGSTG